MLSEMFVKGEYSVDAKSLHAIDAAAIYQVHFAVVYRNEHRDSKAMLLCRNPVYAQ
jgi:hypothetical protein